MWDERLGVVKVIVLKNRVEGLQEELVMVSKKIEELKESRRIRVDVKEVLKQLTSEDVLSPLMDVDDEDNEGDTLEIEVSEI